MKSKSVALIIIIVCSINIALNTWVLISGGGGEINIITIFISSVALIISAFNYTSMSA